MLFTKRESPIRSRTSSVDSGIERVVEDICVRFGVTGRGSSTASAKVDSESKGNKSSFFGLRARNNTIASTTSSFQSLPSITGTSQSSSRSSFDDKAYNSDYCPSFQDYKFNSRRGASREFRATRESSKVSLISTLSRVDEVVNERIVHGASHSASEANLRATGENELKHLISSPFGFQHIAHEGREQFPALRKISHDDSAASLLASQTSQHATQSTNHVQDKNHTWNTSTSAAPEVQGRWSTLVEQTPLTTSIPQPHADNVRQPIKFSNGMTPPPRSSSRNAVARVNLTSSMFDERTVSTYDQIDNSDATEREKDVSKWHNSRGHSRHPTPDMITTSFPRIMDLPHAMTTPDESAVPAISPSYSLDLEDVPEEGEGYFLLGSSKRITQGPLSESSISPQKSTKSLQSWGSRSTVSDSIPTPCSPVRHSASRNRETGRPTLITSFAPDRMRRLSRQFKELDCSWEDDIDFCYENAAEADCDFDWQSPSGCESCVDADLYGEVPFASTLRASQANDTASATNTNFKASGGLVSFPRKDASSQLPFTSKLMEEVNISPKSHCQPVFANNGIGMASSQNLSYQMKNEGTSELYLGIEEISPQLSTPDLHFPIDCNYESKDAATSINVLPSHKKAMQPMLHSVETEKLGPFIFTPRISKTRLSKSSSFESIIQPYSELPSNIRSSNGSFDCISDLAKSRSNTIA